MNHSPTQEQVTRGHRRTAIYISTTLADNEMGHSYDDMMRKRKAAANMCPSTTNNSKSLEDSPNQQSKLHVGATTESTDNLLTLAVQMMSVSNK